MMAARHCRRCAISGLCHLFFLSILLPAQTTGPQIFFTDLLSGPNAGGENDNGAILTITGKGFGTNQGTSTVTLGGGLAADYLAWSDTRISVAIGGAAATGDVVVATTSASSNAVPFAVQPGNIYCVATPADGGDDGNSGLFWDPSISGSACLATLAAAKSRMAPGDITYALDGVAATTLDSAKAAYYIAQSGAPGNPLALVAYPGAQVTIGAPDWADPSWTYAVRDGLRINGSHWVIAGMRITGIQAVDFAPGTSVTDWRLVNNEITCPNGSTELYGSWTNPANFTGGNTLSAITGNYQGFACVASGAVSNIAFYGNYVHDTGIMCGLGTPNGSDACKLYHAVYWSTNSNHIDFGWNLVWPNPVLGSSDPRYTSTTTWDASGASYAVNNLGSAGCRAVQFHSTSGDNLFDIAVHDNLIHDSVCDGLNFGTVAPQNGPVRAYNNVIYNAGLTDPPANYADYACIYSADITNHGTAGSGVVEIFNNTLYNCGPVGHANGAIVKNGANTTLTLDLQNNIVYQTPDASGAAEPYLGGPAAQFSGSANLWYGAGPPPAAFSADLDVDPQFTNLGAADFHLQTTSPAIDAGMDTSALYLPSPTFLPGSARIGDFDGNVRPQGAAFDVGAFEAPGSGAAAATNLRSTRGPVRRRH